MQAAEKIKIIANINSNGGRASTVASRLGISNFVVSSAIDEINNDGIYDIKSGKGGGLELSGGIGDEKESYSHIEKCAEDWMVKNIYGPHGVTGRILRATHDKKLSGKWSTPDFSGLCVHNFQHTKTKRVEIVTFEIKYAPKQFNVSCVYEALAHTRAANYGILFFYDDPLNGKIDADAFDEIKMECLRLGIGMVISQYPCDINCWNYVVPARSFNPDPRRVDAFIEDAFGAADKRWLNNNL
ncbi:hypothetical protein [Magnetospirillum sulfuroxidans]|uniref:Uncharacterized protein n=1 Tax=Magnetospirillum sulfuroxidans TaxID=611300 RepID=A0ABS5I9A7_9PROT|nr:hypothetical protein [Magnetospirillum sulfuroxidans]MBR9970846.1 hypothetical protein [Magnetospirillum sulfuroxidans]